MKVLEYILKFGFMLGLSIVLMLYGGPAFFKKIDSDSVNTQRASGVDEFKLDYTFDSTNYLQFFIVVNSNDTLIKNYFVPEKEHNGIVDFLYKNEIILSKRLSEFLPVILKQNDLEKFQNVQYRLSKNNIESLSINNQILLGKRSSKLKKGIYYTFGVMVCVVGFFGFLLSSMTLFDCIKTYQKTGTFPSLPNSINSKVEGIKYIFRGFKSKNID